MNTKLTLTIEKEVIEIAKEYAKKKDKVSRKWLKTIQGFYSKSSKNERKTTFSKSKKVKRSYKTEY